MGTIKSWMGINRELNMAKAISKYQKYVNEVKQEVGDKNKPFNKEKLQAGLTAIQQWSSIQKVNFIATNKRIPEELASEFRELQDTCQRMQNIIEGAGDVINAQANINRLLNAENAGLAHLNEALQILDQARADAEQIWDNPNVAHEAKEAAAQAYDNAKGAVYAGLKDYQSNNPDFEPLRTSLLNARSPSDIQSPMQKRQIPQLLIHEMLEAKFNLFHDEKPMGDALKTTFKLLERFEHAYSSNEDLKQFLSLPENKIFVEPLVIKHDLPPSIDKVLTEIWWEARSENSIDELTSFEAEKPGENKDLIEQFKSIRDRIDHTGWDQTYAEVEKMKLSDA